MSIILYTCLLCHASISAKGKLALYTSVVFHQNGSPNNTTLQKASITLRVTIKLEYEFQCYFLLFYFNSILYTFAVITHG